MVAIPKPKPEQPPGNTIVPNPPGTEGGVPPWHVLIIVALVVGISIWLIEQYVSDRYAAILAVILLLGVALSYRNFSAELQKIGKA